MAGASDNKGNYSYQDYAAAVQEVSDKVWSRTRRAGIAGGVLTAGGALGLLGFGVGNLRPGVRDFYADNPVPLLGIGWSDLFTYTAVAGLVTLFATTFYLSRNLPTRGHYDSDFPAPEVAKILRDKGFHVPEERIASDSDYRDARSSVRYALGDQRIWPGMLLALDVMGAAATFALAPQPYSPLFWQAEAAMAATVIPLWLWIRHLNHRIDDVRHSSLRDPDRAVIKRLRSEGFKMPAAA